MVLSTPLTREPGQVRNKNDPNNLNKTTMKKQYPGEPALSHQHPAATDEKQGRLAGFLSSFFWQLRHELETDSRRRSVLKLVLLVDLAVILLALFIGETPKYYFVKEHSFVNYLSVLQLLVISFISFELYRCRRRESLPGPLPVGHTIWLLMAIGLLYLALDELFMFHENLDVFIHEQSSMEETGLSDKLDDIIVATYGLIGLIVLYRGRSEILRFKFALPYLGSAFGLLFFSLIFDVLTNGEELKEFLGGGQFACVIIDCFFVIEEVLELFAQVFLIAGFYGFWEFMTAKDHGAPADERAIQP